MTDETAPAHLEEILSHLETLISEEADAFRTRGLVTDILIVLLGYGKGDVPASGIVQASDGVWRLRVVAAGTPLPEPSDDPFFVVTTNGVLWRAAEDDVVLAEIDLLSDADMSDRVEALGLLLHDGAVGRLEALAPAAKPESMPTSEDGKPIYAFGFDPDAPSAVKEPTEAVPVVFPDEPETTYSFGFAAPAPLAPTDEGDDTTAATAVAAPSDGPTRRPTFVLPAIELDLPKSPPVKEKASKSKPAKAAGVPRAAREPSDSSTAAQLGVMLGYALLAVVFGLAGYYTYLAVVAGGFLFAGVATVALTTGLVHVNSFRTAATDPRSSAFGAAVAFALAAFYFASQGAL